MAYNVFIDISDKELGRLSFPLEKMKYAYTASNDAIKMDHLYQTDKETFYKMIDKLKGQDYDIKAKDKLYILPGVGIPKFKIKEYSKSMKATVTTDITKATVIIGSENLNIFDEHYTQPSSNNLFMERLSAYYVQETTEEITLHNGDKVTDIIFSNNAIRADLEEVLISPEYLHKKREELNYMVFPLTLNVIYNVLTKKLPILNEMELHRKFSSSVKLTDESTFNNLMSMLGSSDRDSKDLAVELLCNCDIDGGDYEIWKLSQNFGTAIGSNNRSANLRFFLDASKFHQYRVLNTIEQMFEYFYEKEILTKEIIEKELEKAEEKRKVHLQNMTNIFEVTIGLKKNYQDLVDGELPFAKKEIEDEIEEITEEVTEV